MSDLTPRESALKKINDALSAAKSSAEERAARAEARATELQQRLVDASAQAAGLRAEIERLQRELAAQPSGPAPVVERRSLFGRRRPEPVPVEPEPVAEPEPEPVRQAPLPVFSARPTLPQLEHAALEAERSGRPEAEEWLVYIALLRDHASLDGTIPPQFDDILRDVFGAPG